MRCQVYKNVCMSKRASKGSNADKYHGVLENTFLAAVCK